MSNYNFDLDMDSDNSNSVILRNIKPNSKVLEFGSAYGRMTKYLKENLNCNVHIIDYESEAIDCASKWATASWQIDLNTIPVSNLALDTNYDYIIFADVLEHLMYPENLLYSSKSYLNSNGSIWISIPNIGHNSVLIDLWNGIFKYREIGLLDKTHFRFFTEESLTEMIENCGLKINQKFNLINVVENTEFKNSYTDVPFDVAQELRNRKNGEVYQFVWELKC